MPADYEEALHEVATLLARAELTAYRTGEVEEQRQALAEFSSAAARIITDVSLRLATPEHAALTFAALATRLREHFRL